MFTNHEVARYYELSEVHYRLFWRLEKSRSLHYGLWEPGTKSFHEALVNSNRVLADKAAIKEGENVLDAGCGVGGSSLWLASERNCLVTGITLSAKQVAKAAAFAREAGLEEKVKFEQRDFMNTGFPDNSFDVVWGMESICHAPDKGLFLKEAFRILKKGGRLVMADFFRKDQLQGRPAELVQKFAHSWAVNAFSSWEEFSAQMKAAGFQGIETEDVSEAVRPSVNRLYRYYLLGKPAALLYRLVKGKPTALAGNNVESAYLQYITFKKGWWKYRIVQAVKKEA